MKTRVLAVMSIAGSLILQGDKDSHEDFGVEEIPVRLSFHFVPPRFDEYDEL